MRDRNRNELWGRVFVQELVRSGLSHVCMAPGSRSTPLVLAAAEEPALRIHPFLDERSAAFFALGIGRGTGEVAAVITTSGTAVANLFPAVVEAERGEVPLLLLTADRPRHLRDADANQTIRQERIFGSFPRWFHEAGPPEVTDRALRHLRAVASRAVAEARGRPAGPVHINFPFAKPLEPVPVAGDLPRDMQGFHLSALSGRESERPFTRSSRRELQADPEDVAEVMAEMSQARRPLLVAGPGPDPVARGAALRRAAAALNVPLLADPLSGARRGRTRADSSLPLVTHYDLFLRDPSIRKELEPDFILRLGGSATSSSLLELLREVPDARQVVVDGAGGWKDHLSIAHRYLHTEVDLFLTALADRTLGNGGDGGGRSDWTVLWATAEEEAEATWDTISDEGPFFEGGILREVSRWVDPHHSLFVSSSMPVRDLDAFGGPGVAGGKVFGNRGASGIDGLVSSALGVSVGRGERVVAVLGDLAFHHDMNGLLGVREEGAQVLFVVIHNDGGGIFHMLPIRNHEPQFTPYFATPHGLDFRHAAALYGLPFRRVETRERELESSSGASVSGSTLQRSLTDALDWAEGLGGSALVEVRTDREENRVRREAAVQRIVEAVRRRLQNTRE